MFNLRTGFIALIAMLTLSMTPLHAAASSSLKDIKGHWAEQAILKASKNGIVNGYLDDTFRPNQKVTEAEFLSMLIRSFAEVSTDNTKLKHWADAIYGTAKHHNYPVVGYNDLSARSTAIKRLAVAELLAGANGTTYSGDQAIQFLLDMKFSNGKTAPTVRGYKGQDLLTRAEAVVFIENLHMQGMTELQPRPSGGSSETGSEKPVADGDQVDLTKADELPSTDGMYALSTDEQQLADQINEYREELGLKPFKVSKSMTKVARYHVYDSNLNNPHRSGNNCNLHSWSTSDLWTGMCYTSDHKYAENMWDKPREITNDTYTGDGFEISYWSSFETTPSDALKGWKQSKGHNDVIVGNGYWNDLTVMGVAVDGNYAHVWFGIDEDPNGYFQ